MQKPIQFFILSLKVQLKYSLQALKNEQHQLILSSLSNILNVGHQTYPIGEKDKTE
jgi:hypothetical protein